MIAIDFPVALNIAVRGLSLAKGSEKPRFLEDDGTQSLFTRFKLTISNEAEVRHSDVGPVVEP